MGIRRRPQQTSTIRDLCGPPPRGSGTAFCADSERTSLVERLSELAIVTLASRFSGYGGEKFVVEEVVPLGKEAQRIRSLLAFTDGSSVRLDYAVHLLEDDWRIFNIWFDGVSGTRIKRNEFSGMLRKDGGAAELIKLLDEQIANLAGR